MSTVFALIVNMTPNLEAKEDPKVMEGEELRETIIEDPKEMVVVAEIVEVAEKVEVQGRVGVLEMEVAGVMEDQEIMEAEMDDPKTVNMKRILPMVRFQVKLERIILHFLSNNWRRKDLKAFSQLQQTRLSRTIPNKMGREVEEVTEAVVDTVKEVVVEVGETVLDLWRTVWQPVHLRCECSKCVSAVVLNVVQGNKTFLNILIVKFLPTH